ncbi:translocation/assembly module TamB [Corallococcus sp. AB032C]|uniref:translocation/assembly module TamB domain-containing protein n=3 Tax=Corallococcus TaxID=83461 RepID=UPI000EC923AA|nr:translocation/assembly module TamB domain-containing protein [Corallococcus sp. AB032C]RKH75316.1 translocation/assembly module TamB [Corallococcus sp. AB032C]
MSLPSRNSAARKALLLVLLVVSGSILLLRQPFTWDAACTLARRQLPDLLGVGIGIGRCELDPLGSRVVLHGVSVFAPGSDTPLFAADEAEVGLGFLSPLSRRFMLGHVRVRHPRVALDLSRPSAAPPSSDGMCPLTPLTRVGVGRVDITGAEVRLALPGGRGVEVENLDVGWVEHWGVMELEVGARRGLVRLGAGGGELTLGQLGFTGALDPDEGLLDVERAEVTLDDITATVSGRVETLCHPVLALDAQVFLPLRTLSQAKLLPRPATGHLWTRLSVTGKPSALAVGADLSASNLAYEQYGPVSLNARLSYAGDSVRVESLEAPLGSGKVKLSGALKLTPELPVDVTLQTEDASFGRILERAGVAGSWVDFPATANAHLTGTLLPRPSLSGPLDLRSGRFVLATRAFDAPVSAGKTLLTFERGRAQTAVKLTGDRVSFSRLTVESGRSRVHGDVTLYFDTARGLDIQGNGELELSDFGHIAELPWSGKGSANYSIVGPYSDVKVDASLSLRDFTFWGFGLGVTQAKLSYSKGLLSFPSLTGQKGRTQYFGNAKLTFARLLHLRLDVTVPQGRTEDLVDLVAGLSPSIAVVQGQFAGAASGRVEIDSPLEKLEGLVAFDLRDTSYLGRRLGAGSARLRFVDGKEMVLERTVLDGRLGRTWVEGSFGFTAGALDYRFGGENLSLAEAVGQETAEEMGIQGTLVLAGTVAGSADKPDIQATLKGPRITFASRDLGAMDLALRQEGKQLRITGRPFRDAQGYLNMTVKEPYLFDSTVDLLLPEIKPLLPQVPALAGVTGMLAGRVTLQGPLLQPEGYTVGATVRELSLARGDLRGRNQGPIVLTYINNRLDVQPFRFSGASVDFTLGGWMSRRAINMSLREGRMDVRLLEPLLPGMERVGGQLRVDAEATGSLDAPSVVGTAELSDVRLSMRDLPLTVRGMSGRLEMTGQRVLLEHLQAQVNEGQVSARGDIRLERFVPKRLALTLQLDAVPYRMTEDLPLTVSGLLQVVGPPTGPTVTGGLDIIKLRYQKPLDIEALLKMMQKKPNLAVGGGGERARDPFFTWDVNVHFGDVRVDNNLAKARLLGDVRLTGTDVKPGLLGRVEAAEGSQAFFRNNLFTIDQGQLEFRDASGIDPVFEVQAQTSVREFVVKLHAFGRPANPLVVLSSEPVLTEGDILSLLTLGVTSADKDTAASASYGLAAEALFNVSGLDRQVRRFLPSNPVLRDLSLQISTTYNDATRQAEPTAQLESKFLSEQLKIGMTQPVSGRGTRARAEYRFDDRLSAQAQWDNENSQASFGNLGLELKLGWEVE